MLDVQTCRWPDVTRRCCLAKQDGSTGWLLLLVGRSESVACAQTPVEDAPMLTCDKRHVARSSCPIVHQQGKHQQGKQCIAKLLALLWLTASLR